MSASSSSSALTRLGQVACAVAAFVFVWHAIAAVRLTPVPPVPVAGAAISESPGATLAGPATDAEVDRAVAHDLFSPLREPVRRSAGAAATLRSDAAGTTPATSAPALPVVHGTAASPGGASFAMCALPGGEVVVVRVGDTIGAYTVTGITRARVVFRDPDGRQHTVEAIASPAGDER